MKDDEFIREVNEEYRRDRAAQVWTRYSGVFIGLAVLIVLGVGGWRYWQHAQTVQAEAASQRFDAAVRALKDGEVVGVFPEATISRSFTVKDLKAGAARMAMDAGVPIIPAAVWGGRQKRTMAEAWMRSALPPRAP